MSGTDAPVGTIRVVQDGDVFRIVDDAGRRYYYDWDGSGSGWALRGPAGAEQAWDRCTGFSRREATLLADAIRREQQALAVADELARGLSAFGDAITAAKAWQSRRSDG